MKKAFKAAFPNTVPVLTGFMALGITYGILMQSKGYAFYWALAFSAFCFGGSMQYVAITLLTTVFSPMQAFVLSIMVNARHIFYGISLLKKYKGLGFIKNFLIFWLCDETFSIVSSVEPPEDVDRKLFYFWVSFLDYSYWLVATVIGGIIGSIVTFDTNGFDFVLTALFVVLFLEQWKKKNNRVYCIIGLMATVISRLVFGSNNLIIPAMIIILLMITFTGALKKKVVIDEGGRL